MMLPRSECSPPQTPGTRWEHSHSSGNMNYCSNRESTGYPAASKTRRRKPPMAAGLGVTRHLF
jgi:hypothetical protein